MQAARGIGLSCPDGVGLTEENFVSPCSLVRAAEFFKFRLQVLFLMQKFGVTMQGDPHQSSSPFNGGSIHCCGVPRLAGDLVDDRALFVFLMAYARDVCSDSIDWRW